jgi:hypothetical protein
MSAISCVNDYYASFFKEVALFSIKPYLYTFLCFTAADVCINMGEPKYENENSIKSGIIACVVLTVIPVLPALTAITLGIALLSTVIVALIALFAYPIAFGLDLAACCSSQPENI